MLAAQIINDLGENPVKGRGRLKRYERFRLNVVRVQTNKERVGMVNEKIEEGWEYCPSWLGKRTVGTPAEISKAQKTTQ